MAAREAANRINPDNSLTDQAREAELAVEAVSRSSRVARINPDRSLRIDPAANKPVILNDNTQRVSDFRNSLLFCLNWPLKAIDLSLTPDLYDNSPTEGSCGPIKLHPLRTKWSERGE